MVKYLDNISDDAIVGLNIPNGIPLVYELDAQLKPLRHYYLVTPRPQCSRQRGSITRKSGLIARMTELSAG